MVWLPQNKYIDSTLSLKCDNQIWPWLWPWPWIFMVNYGICYISAKNGPIAMKQQQKIDWTLSLKCDHQIWPWPWPWPWIFKVKHGIHYILAKSGPIATKQKANISIELYVSNVTIGFDLGCDLDLEFSRSNMESTISQPKMVRLPRNRKPRYRSNSMSLMLPSDLTLAMTLTLNFQGQIWNLLYLGQKWFDCHKTNISIQL